jgi:hypothetical protein
MQFDADTVRMDDLIRGSLEREISVDGVVQSWEHHHLVITLAGSVQSRVFRIWEPNGVNSQVCKKLHPGLKIMVLYYASNPDVAVYLFLLE